MKDEGRKEERVRRAHVILRREDAEGSQDGKIPVV
jgi:hypothetical protein